MKARFLAAAATAGLMLALGTAVVGQAPLPGGGGGTQLGQFGGGGAQTGVAPQPNTLALLPNQQGRLALYCVDLFHDSPTDRHEYRAAPDARAVVVAGAEQMPLHEAIASGLLSVRGRDATGDPPRDNRQWIDLYLTNHTGSPVVVSFPAGYSFVPKGRTPPALAPGLVRMLETAYHARLTGSDTLAYAMWASRGFTREDVEQTQLRPLADAEAARVQKLLDTGGIEQRFDRDRGSYERLYAEREAALGEETNTFSGTAALAGGRSVSVRGEYAPSGSAVVSVQPERAPAPLRYAARLRSIQAGKAELELLHLKTGRRLQVNHGRIVVRLKGASTGYRSKEVRLSVTSERRSSRAG